MQNEMRKKWDTHTTDRKQDRRKEEENHEDPNIAFIQCIDTHGQQNYDTKRTAIIKRIGSEGKGAHSQR